MTTVTTASQEESSHEEERDVWKLGRAVGVLMGMIGFEPTGEEQARILRCRKPLKLVVGGDQSGKSIEASADFIVHLYEDLVARPAEKLLYWLVAVDYERTRREFEYISEFLGKLGLPVEASKRVDPGYIEVQYIASKDEPKPRLRIETKSAKDPRTLAMFAPHGIVGCEASQWDLETYFRCLSRIAPTKGWLHLSGSYETSLGWYPGLAAAWAHGNKDQESFRLPTPSNWHLYPEGESDPHLLRLKRESSDAFYMERIMGIAAPPRGLVLVEFRPDIHIREVEYDAGLPVYIWEDPGYGHAHAIEVAQVTKREQVRVFDEIYERGIITQDMITVCMQRLWWRNPDKTLVIDPHYATQHHATPSIADIWAGAPAHLTAMGTKVTISEGNERIKSFLKVNPLTGEPGIVFHPKCRGILSELGAYPNPFDGQTKVYSWKMDREGNVIGDEPDNRNNDGIAALRYGLVERFGLTSGGASKFFVMTQRHHPPEAHAVGRKKPRVPTEDQTGNYYLRGRQ